MYINLLNEVKGKVDSEYNKALGELWLSSNSS
jgi:hypothetical protein